MFLRYTAIFLLAGSASLVYATTPVVTVKSPAKGASVGSPVNFIASASSPECSTGISAIRIYTAPGVSAYTIDADTLNTNINLPTGSYSTVVEAWDNCGGVGTTTVDITVSKITLPPPSFLFATENSQGLIAGYTVDPLTGSISPTSQGTVAAGSYPDGMAADSGGYRLYVANEESNNLSAYFIYRNNGELVPVPGSPFDLAGNGIFVAVHPSGDYVYASSVPSSGPYQINAFAVQSNGSLTPVPGSPFTGQNAAAQAIAITPNGKYLYASGNTNSDGDGLGAVAAYAIDTKTGALTPVAGSPFVIPPYSGCQYWCQGVVDDVAVDPEGKYVYATLSLEDGIAGYKIDQSTGALTDLPGSPYPEGQFCTSPYGYCNWSWQMSIDPNGKFIYVGDIDSSDLSIFSLKESTGVPAYIGATANTQDGICVPYTLGVDPSGAFLYSFGLSGTECQGTHAILGLSINQSNGSLLPVPGSPFLNANVNSSNNSLDKVVITP
jgi:6-phosphogluconolactonase (cycloisomerase 2 family)